MSRWDNKTVEDRFWEKVSHEPNSGCWLWTGSLDGHGYGQMRVSGKTVAASHLSLEMHGRPRPQKMCALHKCDNPICCNPDHLEWGSMRLNTQQMIARGRNDFSGLEKGREKLRQRRREVSCYECDARFIRIPSQIPKSGRNFCSQKCLISWQKKEYTGKSRKHWGWGKNSLS